MQGIFITVLSIPMVLWFVMSFSIKNSPCRNYDECREDAINARITNIN